MSVPQTITGYRPDPPHRRTQKLFASHFAGAAISFPPQGAIKQFAAPTYSQGDTGSCGGHGIAQQIFTALAAAGKPLPWLISPKLTYAITRALEVASATPPGAPVPALLDDTGVIPSDLTTAISQWGVAPLLSMDGATKATPDNWAILQLTPDNRLSDVWGPLDIMGLTSAPPVNVNDRPNFDALEDAHMKLVVGEYRIDEMEPQAPQLAAACIGVKQAPLGIGIFVDSAFMQWQAGMLPLDSVNLSDPRGGGHWITLDHYYTAAAGTLIFELNNSWGKSWGDQGRIRVTENWFRQAVLDIYPMTVTLQEVA